jgi:hypothetical protein
LIARVVDAAIFTTDDTLALEFATDVALMVTVEPVGTNGGAVYVVATPLAV